MINLKSLFCGLFFLTFITTIYGQTHQFELGLEGGPSLISIRGNRFIDHFNEPTIGFTGGLFFQYNLKKIVSLRTNIAFERKGSLLTSKILDNFGNPIGEMNTNMHFDYLTLPILVRAKFGEKVQFFFNAGPYIGYLIKQHTISKGDNIPSFTFDNTSQYKRFDTGISTGLGLSVPVKTKFAFTFEARNNLGLLNVSHVQMIDNGTIKTNSTNLILGFTYKLGQSITE